MNDQTPVVRECSNECQLQGTEDAPEPSPMLATHGLYCDRCFSRLAYPLRLAGDLAEHITSKLAGGGSTADESLVKTSKAEAPLPMNEAAFNDVNGMYETLIYLARYFARKLAIDPPTPATRAWRSEAGHIKGLPANASPAAARYQVFAVATWLETRLNAILAIADRDDIEGFTGRMQTIAVLASRHQMKMKARYSPMPHRTEHCDEGKIAVYPPRRAGDRELIICEGCGATFSDTYYLQLLAEWKDDQLAARRKANREKASTARRTAQHLAAKYAGDLMLTTSTLGRTDQQRQREYDSIRDALAEAALDVPPGGVLVTHNAGSIAVTITHDVPAGKVRHAHRAGGGHIEVTDDPIGAS